MVVVMVVDRSGGSSYASRASAAAQKKSGLPVLCCCPKRPQGPAVGQRSSPKCMWSCFIAKRLLGEACVRVVELRVSLPYTLVGQIHIVRSA